MIKKCLELAGGGGQLGTGKGKFEVIGEEVN